MKETKVTKIRTGRFSIFINFFHISCNKSKKSDFLNITNTNRERDIAASTLS